MLATSTALALVVVASAAAELRLDPQMAVAVELDTNAQRVPSGQLGVEPGEITPPKQLAPPVADGLLRADGGIALALDYQGLALRSDLALGGKWFFTQSTESMLVAQLRTSASSTKLPGDVVATLAGLVKARAQLSGARTYAYARSDAVVEKLAPWAIDWLVLRGGINGVGFMPYEPEGPPLPNADSDDECDRDERTSDLGDEDCELDTSISSAGGGLMGGARFLVGPNERIDVLVDAGARGFPFFQFPSRERRVDGVYTGLVQLTTARKLYVSVGWLGIRNASNASGESFTRHRLNAAVGFRLPAELTVTAQAAVQLTFYDEGVGVSQPFFLGDEDNQNFLQVIISRRIVDGLYLEAQGLLIGNEFAVEGARFARQTASLGIRGELPE